MAGAISISVSEGDVVGRIKWPAGLARLSVSADALGVFGSRADAPARRGWVGDWLSFCSRSWRSWVVRGWTVRVIVLFSIFTPVNFTGRPSDLWTRSCG